jgi:hypothetical protein
MKINVLELNRLVNFVMTIPTISQLLVSLGTDPVSGTPYLSFNDPERTAEVRVYDASIVRGPEMYNLVPTQIP